MKTSVRKSGRPLGLLFFAVVAAVAQTNSSSNGPAMAARSGQLGGVITAGGIGFGGAIIGPGSPLETVTGRPYSAEQVTEHVQTLADGTHIAQLTQKVMLYRDSEGRTRMERSFSPPAGAVTVSSLPVFTEITDPVAGYRYMLDRHSHVARRAPWPPAMRRISQAATPAGTNSRADAPSGIQQPISNPQNPAVSTSVAAAARPRPEMKRESLGTQTMDGIAAEGTRMTMTFPEGTIGNDRPITTVSETWTSRDLNVVVLAKVSDPRNGDSTTKLSNVSQSEPASDLFQVPADYSIIDEQPSPQPLPMDR